MTIEQFKRAEEIFKEKSSLEKDNEIYKKRAERIGEYLKFLDGRIPPIKAYGKTYKKVDIKFNMDEHPVNTHVEDLFDLVEDNKKDFITFLKSSIKNYEKLVTDNLTKIETLSKELSEL